MDMHSELPLYIERMILNKCFVDINNAVNN